MASEADDSGNNAKGSGGVSAWARLLKALALLVWAVVALIVVSGLGYYFFIKDMDLRGSRATGPKPSQRAKPVPPVLTELDKEIDTALVAARQDARDYAEGQLDQWKEVLKQRVSHDFADWYFGYWNTQVRGAKALFDGAAHWIDSGRPTAQERMTEEFQHEFAIRVLQPATSQRILERIQRQTLERFLSNLKAYLDKIPQKYNISTPDWELYLDEISGEGVSVEAGRSMPVTIKAVYVSTAAGAILLGQKIIAAMSAGVGTGVASKVGAKLAGKVGAKLAAKTGAKVASKFGGQLLGPIVGAGVIVWDAWDHVSTEKENRPILINNIYGYLDEMTLSLLDDPESGVMAATIQVEAGMRQAMAAAGARRKPASTQPAAAN